MVFSNVAFVSMMVIQIDYVVWQFKNGDNTKKLEIKSLVFIFIGIFLNLGVMIAVSNLLGLHIYLWKHNLTTLEYLRLNNKVPMESKIKIKVIKSVTKKKLSSEAINVDIEQLKHPKRSERKNKVRHLHDP